jgi:hypothetical protein
MIPNDVVRRVADATNIVELIGEVVQLRRGGQNFVGLCPFHQEKSGSFNVSSARQRYHCFGCGADGDAIKFVQEREGLEFVEAVRRLAARAGIYIDDSPEVERTFTKPAVAPPVRREKKRGYPELPALHDGTQSDWRALAALRGLREQTIYHAVSLDWVRFGEWRGQPAWFVLDRSKCNAQARRMDGRPVYDKIKADTVKGSWAKWPLGISEAQHQTILLTEGGPDWLAALEIIDQAGLHASPCGVLGASMPLHEKSLPFFAGKRVFIAEHADPAGAAASARWSEQLDGIAEVHICPMPDDDLNDAVRIYDLDECLSFLPGI